MKIKWLKNYEDMSKEHRSQFARASPIDQSRNNFNIKLNDDIKRSQYI